MTIFAVVVLVAVTAILGFLAGAVIIGALICDRIHLSGRFDAGPVVIVGKLEHKHGNWK